MAETLTPLDVIAKNLLAYCLRDRIRLIEIIEQVDNTFFPLKFRKVYAIIRKHFADHKALVPLDVFQVYLSRSKTADDEVVYAVALYNELQVLQLDESQFNFYLEEIKAHYVSSQLYQMVGHAVEGSNPEEDMIKFLTQRQPTQALELVKDRLRQIDEKVRPLKARGGILADTAEARREEYEAVRDNPELAMGYLTGFERFDEVTHGIQNGEFAMFYGPSGAGKSITLMNVGYYGYSTGKNVLYVSIEMAKKKCEARLTSRMSGLDYKKMKRGELEDDQQELYFEILAKQKDMNNYWYTDDVPRGCTAEHIYGTVERLISLYGAPPDIILVDYLELMSPSAKVNSDTEALGVISEELHELARYSELPVASASQITSRRNKNTRDEVGQHRIARAERIIHNSDIAVQIVPGDLNVFNDQATTEELSDELQYYITKNRDNPIDTFAMKKDFSRMLISNIARVEKPDINKPGVVEDGDAFITPEEEMLLQGTLAPEAEAVEET